MPIQEDVAVPVGYTIEVCRTCGRKAEWPFCEHRPERYEPGADSWLMPVRVTLQSRDRRRLRDEMQSRFRR